MICIINGTTNKSSLQFGFWGLCPLFTGSLYCHWRRQLWGTGARAPLDFQLVILGITRFTDSDESYARFSVQ